MSNRLPGRRVLLWGLGLALILSAFAGSVNAQEARGAITGLVKDQSGGVMPDVKVTVTNAATNIATSATSNQEGRYDLLYLAPGQYKLSTERTGFKKTVRTGLEVRVGDRLVLDLTLEPGGLTESVEVVGGAPLLNAGTASLGQVVDARRIVELPLSDHNPFVLARQAPGISYTGDYKFSRAFDNGGVSAVVANGATGGNEFTLDGAPNMCNDRRVAFVPPADAVAEFKVETANFDAQQGHTGGAVINVVLKSGTNDFKGMLQYMNRGDKLAANDFFLNRAGKPKGKQKYNVVDALLSGPIKKDRTFFMVMGEGMKDQFPEPQVLTVPTDAERAGDFSALLPSIVIYNPFSAESTGSGHVVRKPFDGNKIPSSMINSMAQGLLKYFPAPNTPSDTGKGNYVTENPRKDKFYSTTVRLDHQFNAKHRGTLRYSHNYRREDRNLWWGDTGGIPTNGNYLYRINDAFIYDHVWNLSSNSILDIRASFSRFREQNLRPSEGLITPADLGFSAQAAAAIGPENYFPQFDLLTMDDIGYFGGGAGQTPGRGSKLAFNIASFQPTLTKIIGKHQLRFGLDIRSYRENVYQYNYSGGLYSYNNTYTGKTDPTGQDAADASTAMGQDFASFLLGLPAPKSYIDRNASRANETVYYGIFAQDDLRLSSKLTLNLGLRYDYESPLTERYNRNLRGFDTVDSSSITAKAQAAYASNPVPNVPVANFAIGGPLFASDSQRGFWDGDKSNIQPRVGFTYQLDDKTVVRGGWGIYMIPNLIGGVSQPGFSQQTSVIPSDDNGLTFKTNITNPFPNGITAPSGSSQGLATFVGNSLEFFPLDLKNGRLQRMQIGVQRELPGSILVEAVYLRSHSYDLTVVDDSLNAVPAQYLSTLPARDNDTISRLSAQVANPFRGLATPGTPLNSGQYVAVRDLLRPYAQFPVRSGSLTGLRTRNSTGTAEYNALQLRAEKRFSKGFTLIAAYTYSKNTEKMSYLNPTDTNLEDRLSLNDTPHRLSVSGILELPFGKGRHWGSNWSGLADGILGGWQVGAVYMIQSGVPLDLSGRDYYYDGDYSQLKSKVSGATVNNTFNTGGFYFSDGTVQKKVNGVPTGEIDPALQRTDSRINLVDHIRAFPTRISGMRAQTQNLLDVSLIKNVTLRGNTRLQLRAEAINALNHPLFNTPNLNPTSSDFGKTTGQLNLPRSIQVGVKLLFN